MRIPFVRMPWLNPSPPPGIRMMSGGAGGLGSAGQALVVTPSLPYS